MSKIHTELKDLQGHRYTAGRARRQFKSGRFSRPDGTPMSGVDITYLACYRQTRATGAG